MLLFVGLGNPGEQYQENRHNIGFMAVNALARRLSFAPWKVRFQGDCAEGRIKGRKILLLKPATYMNQSGRAVQEAARFYKIPLDDIFVFHDDLDLAPAKIRVKQGGGHGGHNGLRSIDAQLGKDYWRIRQGIGRPGDKSRVHGYVLGDFAKADQAWLTSELQAFVRHIDLLTSADKNNFASRVGQDIQAALAPKPNTQAKERTSQESVTTSAPPNEDILQRKVPALAEKTLPVQSQSSPKKNSKAKDDSKIIKHFDALKNLFGPTRK